MQKTNHWLLIVALIISHGMFLLPWGTGTRNEKTATNKVTVPLVEGLQSPINCLPPMNKMKRKRGGSGELGSHRLGIAPAEFNVENKGHVELPLPECSGVETLGHRHHNTPYASTTSPPLTPVERPGETDWQPKKSTKQNTCSNAGLSSSGNVAPLFEKYSQH